MNCRVDGTKQSSCAMHALPSSCRGSFAKRRASQRGWAMPLGPTFRRACPAVAGGDPIRVKFAGLGAAEHPTSCGRRPTIHDFAGCGHQKKGRGWRACARHDENGTANQVISQARGLIPTRRELDPPRSQVMAGLVPAIYAALAVGQMPGTSPGMTLYAGALPPTESRLHPRLVSVVAGPPLATSADRAASGSARSAGWTGPRPSAAACARPDSASRPASTASFIARAIRTGSLAMRDRRVQQHRVAAQLHRDRRVGRGAHAGIDQQRHLAPAPSSC